MELIRIGDKVINKNKIFRMIEKILNLRSQGLSQTEVARELEVERTFISRLESLGEVHKGGRIAIVGFPIANVEEIREMALNEGVEFVLLMSEKERWSFIKRDGLDIFNQIMEILIRLKEYDLVIFLGSDMRIDLADTLLEGKVVGIELGTSPITEDKYIDPSILKNIIKNFRK
ncbi:helix-turn-helix domain-containing protein [Anoxybacter fermentans]|nr:helix-turn-helix domain-containing protein [Anoxybacter fermentans]